MKTFFRVLVPVLVLGGAIGIATLLMLTRPNPPTRPPASVKATVDAVRLELQPVGTVGVGFDDICPAGDIDIVDARNQLWIGDAQMLVAGVDEHPLGVDHRSHGAVEDQWAFFDKVKYLGHGVVSLVMRNT